MSARLPIAPKKMESPYLFVQTGLLSLWAIISWASRAQAAEQSTLFRQESKVLGAADLLVSKSGIRLSMPKTNLTLIAHAPDWKLVFLSSTGHKYFVTTAGHFRAPSAISISLIRTSDTSILKPHLVEESTLLGVKANKIEMVGEPPLKTGDRHWQKLLLHSATVWTQPIAGMPPHVVRAIEEMYALPANKGVPLQVVTVNNKGRQEKELTLLKISSKPFNAGDFTVPANYAPVTNQEDLIEKKSDEIMDLIP